MTTESKAFTPVVRGVIGDGVVSVVIATLAVIDRDGDVTERGAFGSQQAQILAGHDWSTGISLGRASIREEGAEVVATLKMNLAIPAAVDMYESFKFDVAHPPALQQFSYGYDVLDSAPGQHSGRRVRLLKRLAVHEVSPVVLGAGVGTRLLSVKRHAPAPARDALPADVRAELQRMSLRSMRDRVAADREKGAQRAELSTLMARSGVAHNYVEVSSTAVAPAAVRAAGAAVKRYAARLGVGGARVRWFAEAAKGSTTDDIVYTSFEPCAGFTFPKSAQSVVWIAADLPPDRAYSIAAHEVAHLAGRDEPGAQLVEQVARAELAEQHNLTGVI